MPYLMAACDIYAGPSRLEGFGITQVEAGACGKPVIGIKAMGMLDTLVHGQTAFLAEVAEEVRITEGTSGEEEGYEHAHRVVFRRPQTVDYRASVHDIAEYLLRLMIDEKLRQKMGEAARKRVVERFDYRVVAKSFMQIVSKRLRIPSNAQQK
jgi:glycosyltransferase involved in cell wall biosynthesis